MINERSQIQLNRTGLWVPKDEAKFGARVIYSEFSDLPKAAEDLARLSYGANAGFDTPAAKNFLSRPLVEELAYRGYFDDTIASLAARATTKTLVAMSMIVADLDEGTISGYLVEPFANKEILPELYSVFGGKKVHPVDFIR